MNHVIHDKKLKELEEIALKIRKDIIEMLLEAKSGHSAGPLGFTDVMTALYFHVLNIDPKNPAWPERDRFLFSNGHMAPVWYATLAERGYFPKKELLTLRKLGTRLQGHPHCCSLPGVDASSGPLGQGISMAAGMALAGKRDNKSWRVFCMMGDG